MLVGASLFWFSSTTKEFNVLQMTDMIDDVGYSFVQ